MKKLLDVWDTEHPLNQLMNYKKDAPAQEVMPMVAPTAPVEEASVDIGDEDDDDKEKLKTSKKSLKIPLVKDATNTGVRF